MFNRLFAFFVIALVCLMSFGFIVAQDYESNYSYTNLGVDQVNTYFGKDTLKLEAHGFWNLPIKSYVQTTSQLSTGCQNYTTSDKVATIESFTLSDGSVNCLSGTVGDIFSSVTQNRTNVPIIISSESILPIKFNYSNVKKVDICTAYLQDGTSTKYKAVNGEGKLRIWSNEGAHPYAEVFFKKDNSVLGDCFAMNFYFPEGQYLTQIDVVYFSEISGDGYATLHSLITDTKASDLPSTTSGGQSISTTTKLDCKDSDGNNIFTKGTVTGWDYYGTKKITTSDYCTATNGGAEVEKGKYVAEELCDSENKAHTYYYECSGNGMCVNGACTNNVALISDKYGITEISTPYGPGTINTNTVVVNGKLFDFKINRTPILGDESCKSLTDDYVSVNSYEKPKNCLIAASKSVFGSNLEVPVIVGSYEILPIHFDKPMKKVQICTGYVKDTLDTEMFKLIPAEGKLRIWSNKTDKPFAEIFFKKSGAYAAHCFPIEFNFPEGQYLTQIDLVYFSEISGSGRATLNSLKYELDDILKINPDLLKIKPLIDPKVLQYNAIESNVDIIKDASKLNDKDADEKIADLEARVSKLEELVGILWTKISPSLSGDVITVSTQNPTEVANQIEQYQNEKAKDFKGIPKKTYPNLYVPETTSELEDIKIITELDPTNTLNTETPIIDICKIVDTNSILCNGITKIVCVNDCVFYEYKGQVLIKNLDQTFVRVKDLDIIKNAIESGRTGIELSYTGVGNYKVDLVKERNNFITKLILPRVDSTVNVPLRPIQMGSN